MKHTQDLSQLLEAQQAEIARLHAQLAHLKHIIEKMPGYVYWKNRQSEYMGCNEHLAQFSQLNSADEIIGKKDVDFSWGKETGPLFQNEDQTVMQTGRPLITINEITRSQDEAQHIWVRTIKTPFYDESGAIIGVLAIATDITEEKAAETLRIKNAQLTAQYRLAQQIGHDLRSPLTALGILLKSCAIPTDSQRTSMEQCLKQINLMAGHLLNDYQGPKTSEDSPVHWAILPLLQKLLEQKRHQYAEQHMTFELADDAAAYAFCFFQGDGLSFQRMCSNLINNSVDAYGGATGTIILSLTADKKHIRLCVQDHGAGMPPDVLHKITEQVPVTSGKAHGHGIGMGQVHDALAGLNGTMRITSQVGVGTTVTLTIPRSETPQNVVTQLILDPQEHVDLMGVDAQSESQIRQKLMDHPQILIRTFSDSRAYEGVSQPISRTVITSDLNTRSTETEKTYLLLHNDCIGTRQEASCILPSLIPHMAFQVVSAAASANRYATVQLVVVEDSRPLVMAFQCILKEHHKDTCTDFYHTAEDLMNHYTDYGRDTRFCIDYSLEGALNGIDLIQLLHQAGYRNLYLCTGWEAMDVKSRLPLGVEIVNKSDLERMKEVMIGASYNIK